MKIFSNEFKNYLKSFICVFLGGHKVSEWMQQMWAPGHFSGTRVRLCNRCNKILQEEDLPERNWNEVKMRSGSSRRRKPRRKNKRDRV